MIQLEVLSVWGKKIISPAPPSSLAPLVLQTAPIMHLCRKYLDGLTLKGVTVAEGETHYVSLVMFFKISSTF